MFAPRLARSLRNGARDRPITLPRSLFSIITTTTWSGRGTVSEPPTGGPEGLTVTRTAVTPTTSRTSSPARTNSRGEAKPGDLKRPPPAPAVRSPRHPGVSNPEPPDGTTRKAPDRCHSSKPDPQSTTVRWRNDQFRVEASQGRGAPWQA